MTENECDKPRYQRQVALPEIGSEGQERLLGSAVLVVGLGGLGSPAAFYLAAAGVGRLGLVDDDVVDPTNLQRQILHADADVGRSKIESAVDTLSSLNPDITVQGHDGRFTSETIGIVEDYDFVVDATDNFEGKSVIAMACRDYSKVYSYAGVDRFLGQTMTVKPGETACFGCLFGVAPLVSDGKPVGPLGVVPGVIGTVQASEAIKSIVGFGELLTNRMLIYDSLKSDLRTVEVKREMDCEICGSR